MLKPTRKWALSADQRKLPSRPYSERPLCCESWLDGGLRTPDETIRLDSCALKKRGPKHCSGLSMLLEPYAGLATFFFAVPFC